MTLVVTPCTPPPTVPKVADRIFRSTVAGSGLKCFRRLKNSERNSSDARSLIRVDLVTEKSTFSIPGRRTAFVRGEVPNRPNGACVNAPVLNHRVHVR